MSGLLDRLTLLQTFVRIADAGSISAAARSLGTSQPTASRQLAELETRFESQLVRRTAHSLALTAAGVALLADARRLLDTWEALEEAHGTEGETLRGKLVVVAPVAFGQLALARIAFDFQLEHPEVSLAWHLDDHEIRFAEIGCDCWIIVGSVPDDTLVAKRVGRVERWVVASPGLLERHGLPSGPAEAEALPWAVLEPFEGGQIPLTAAEGGERVDLRPQARMATNNIFALREAARRGLGLAVLPRWFVEEMLVAGELANALPGWLAPTLDVHLAYRPGRYRPRRLQVFLDAMAAAVPTIPGIDPPARPGRSGLD